MDLSIIHGLLIANKPLLLTIGVYTVWFAYNRKKLGGEPLKKPKNFEEWQTFIYWNAWEYGWRCFVAY